MKLQYTIHAAFSARAAALPDRTARVSGDDRLSYAELDQRSTGVARYLMHQGVRVGDRVGVYSQRSSDAVTALLGILKAGAAYVPFDPAYPAKLLGVMADDCAPALMLAQADLLQAGAAPFWSGAVHDLHTVTNLGVEVGDAAALPTLDASALAYVMYTSGSTGQPKGVLIPHRGVLRLVIDNPFADMGSDQVHLLLAPLAFDASTFEIWGALLNGATLGVVASPLASLDDIAAAILRYGVTTLWLTAGLFHLMVDHRLDGLAPLKQLIAGGDVRSPPHVARAQAALPNCQLIKGYGPTENTTFTCCYRIPRPAPAGPVPIGTPIAQTTVYIADEAMGLVADGQEGELCAGGAGLALGYLNRDALTAERFVEHPLDPTGRTRLYRTGDRVRRRADGNIEFMGRVDRQVKIMGKRVELDDIEACIRRSQLIEDAAVISPPGGAGLARKVHAFVTFRPGAVGGVRELQAFLRSETPDHMMPSTFTVMESLPLSPTGKVDRSKLVVPRTDAALRAPTGRNATEEMLLDIWRSVLGNPAVGVDDNFFDLGGTSLQVLQVHATISGMISGDLTLLDLFQFPRISALAARLAPSRVAETPQTVLSADQRARGQQAALARARARVGPRRNA